MERENQLELLEKLVQAHIKNRLFLHLQHTCEDFLTMGLDSLSKCLSKKVNPDRLIAKMDLETQMKINEYSRIWAKKIVNDYEKKLRE